MINDGDDGDSDKCSSDDDGDFDDNGGGHDDDDDNVGFCCVLRPGICFFLSYSLL